MALTEVKSTGHLANSTGKSDHRIPQLDGWRGLSILGVVAGHLLVVRYGVAPDSTMGRAAGILSSWGVCVFFVISGFIIAKLALRELKLCGRFSICDFYIRRCFRIIPPYFLYLGCVAVANGLSWIDQPISGVLAAGAFICNFPSPRCGWAVAHTWTLAIEEQFYIGFPLLFVFFNRQLRTTFGTIFCILVAMPILRFLFQLEGGWRFVSSVAPSYAYICIGVLAAAYEDNIRVLSQGRAGHLISAAAGFVVVGFFLSDTIATVPLRSVTAYLQVLLHIVFLPISLAWLVAASVHQSNRFVWMLRAAPLQFVGLISYSLYLWQQLFTGSPQFLLSRSPLQIWPLMFLVATLSYYVIERSAVRAGKWLVGKTNRVDGAVRSYRSLDQVSAGEAS
jgi:peptidoglycan/LPS O-acetylase OafA/YrhL